MPETKCKSFKKYNWSSLLPALHISASELLSYLNISAVFLIKISDILKYKILYSIQNTYSRFYKNVDKS